MLVAERQRKIVELVNKRSSIRVTELSKIFSVTEETIRRDLEKLEKNNMLHRSHGGAVSIEKEQVEIPYTEREITKSEEKKSIAAAAISLVQPGEQIILDASSTAWYMAVQLPDIPLTVITNSIKVSIELSKKEQIRVISTGGNLLPRSLSFVGPLAERSLSMYHVNKAFISCKGIHIESGLNEVNELQAILKTKMMNIAEQTIVMADSSKFGIRSFVQVAPLTEVQQIITDSQIPDEYKRSIIEKNIKLKTVEA